MRIVHRISVASSPEAQAELARMSVVVGAEGLVTFEVDESWPSWPEIKRWATRRKAADVVSTRFTSEEIRNAAWLELVPDWHYGYPQPNEDDFGYLGATYDLSNFCRDCGIGLRQRAPFQMKREPAWGKHQIMQLNWVFDEYFVTPALWTMAFRPLHVGCREVLDARGMVLASVVQLVIEEKAAVVSMQSDAQPCSSCGRTKYPPNSRGGFPPLVCEPVGAIAKTTQYFGSGKEASNCVLVSRQLAAALHGVQGASFRPVQQGKG